MTVSVLQPAACPRCQGSGVLGPVTMSWCPDCSCVQCGAKTDTAPICRDCVAAVETRLAAS